MKPIKREDIPFKCPKCMAFLKAYHGPGSVTRLICSALCSGYSEVVIIDHNAEARKKVDAIILCT